MKQGAEKELSEIENSRNLIFQKLKMMKKNSCDITSNDCVKNKKGRIVFAEDDRKRV